MVARDVGGAAVPHVRRQPLALMEIVRQHAALMVLPLGIGGLALVTLSGSQPSPASEQLAAGSGLVAIEISGVVPGPLRPGVVHHLDLTFTNPLQQDVVLTSVSVSIASISAPRADQESPCPAGSFIAGSGQLTPTVVPANHSVTLSGIGVPRNSWPWVRMVDFPVNQDGCKGSAVTLAYSAVGEVR